MTDDLVQKIAEEILNQGVWGNYKFYLLVMGVSLASACLGAYFSAYLKRKGENYATKEDFAEILHQLKDTTTLTESIKSDISARSAEGSAIRTLMRQKMEALFEKTLELELWMEQSRSTAIEGKLPDVNSSPIARIGMYQSIYFQNLASEMATLDSRYFPMLQFTLDLAGQALAAKQNGQVLDWHSNNAPKFAELHPLFLAALNGFRKALLEKHASGAGL